MNISTLRRYAETTNNIEVKIPNGLIEHNEAPSLLCECGKEISDKTSNKYGGLCEKCYKEYL